MPQTDKNNAKTCGAKTRSGTPCKLHPVSGRERCRLHGGLTPRGAASPHFKHGRYTRDVPTRLVARYEESLASQSLLELDDDIALVDAFIGEQLARMGDERVDYVAILRTLNAFKSAMNRKDTNAASTHLSELSTLVEQAQKDAQAKDEVVKLVEQRRRLVETQRKTLIDMQQMITVERAMLLVGAIVDIVRNHVDDSTVLASIGRDIEKQLAA